VRQGFHKRVTGRHAAEGQGRCRRDGQGCRVLARGAAVRARCDPGEIGRSRGGCQFGPCGASIEWRSPGPRRGSGPPMQWIGLPVKQGVGRRSCLRPVGGRSDARMQAAAPWGRSPLTGSLSAGGWRGRRSGWRVVVMVNANPEREGPGETNESTLIAVNRIRIENDDLESRCNALPMASASFPAPACPASAAAPLRWPVCCIPGGWAKKRCRRRSGR